MSYLYIIGTILFTVYGQLIIKWRIAHYGSFPENSDEKLAFLFKAVLDPYIFSGLVAAFVASLFWIAAMSLHDLSFAYPIVTAGLTLITASMAILLFNESITGMKIVGITCILAGVITMSYTT